MFGIDDTTQLLTAVFCEFKQKGTYTTVFLLTKEASYYYYGNTVFLKRRM